MMQVENLFIIYGYYFNGMPQMDMGPLRIIVFINMINNVSHCINDIILAIIENVLLNMTRNSSMGSHC